MPLSGWFKSTQGLGRDVSRKCTPSILKVEDNETIPLDAVILDMIFLFNQMQPKHISYCLWVEPHSSVPWEITYLVGHPGMGVAVDAHAFWSILDV